MSGKPQIGDTVYHLYGGGFGDMPCIHKGTVTAIYQDGYYQVGPGHVAQQERCYKDVHQLLNAIREHINNETLQLDNCIYDW